SCQPGGGARSLHQQSPGDPFRRARRREICIEPHPGKEEIARSGAVRQTWLSLLYRGGAEYLAFYVENLTLTLPPKTFYSIGALTAKNRQNHCQRLFIMPDTTSTTSYIERARKVLQYEQRNNHQDRLVQGGLELLASRWAEEFSVARKEAGLDLSPVYRFMEHMEGYRHQDPTQRAANVRAALTILDLMERDGADEPLTGTPATQTSRSRQTGTSEHTSRSNGGPAPASANQLPTNPAVRAAISKPPPDMAKISQKKNEEL